MSERVARTIQSYFRDWESDLFGYGYGSGERHTLAAVKMFFAMVGFEEPADRQGCYDYKKLEAALNPVVAWMLINIFCRANILEYGTSPRYAWLTEQGEALKRFIDATSLDELEAICAKHDPNEPGCSRLSCNCGPNGYQEGVRCANPFWDPKRGVPKAYWV